MSQQPIHQVVLNGSISDVGSAASSIEVNDSDNRITYVNNDGKDSIFINSDGYSPKINIPFAINTGSFTYGVWIKLVSYDAWCMPISINSGASISVGFGLSRELLTNGGDSVVSSYSYYGDGTVNYANWNHIGISYSNGLITFYLNGNSRLTISGSVSTSAQITIGGNAQYQSNFGGQQTWSGYLHQLCIFDYALSSAEMTNLAAQTQGNDILGPPPNPLIPRDLVVSVTTTSFTVSWTAEGATSYTFTVNDSPVTPSTQEDNSATFTDLTSNTVYALVITAINDTESQSSNPTSITTMPDPPGSINVSTSVIKSSSFVASWTGGERATSYTYTLNGTAATPSINNALTDKTVKFTGLTPTTAYTLVVKAINISGEAESTATLTTLDPPPLEPVHQVVFSDSADDLGTSVIEVGTGDVIEYTNYYGKDSVYINSDGTNPRIYTPCVFTDATPFTFAFWINFENVGAWCIPISMNGPNIYIALGFDFASMYLSIGNGEGGLYNQANFFGGSDFRTWNHITVTYSNGTFTIYKNGVIGGSLSIQSGFTTSQITIGGNVQYQLHLGGQANWAGYLHQLCVFDSVLSTQDISLLVTQTQGNKVFITPTNSLTPYQLELTNLSYTEFTVSWLSVGESYTFTLNGDAVTPTQTTNSATFTGLTPNTAYVLLITAVNGTESQTSAPKTVRTMKPLPNPVHQFVFNGLTDDVGTTPSAMIVEDPDSIIEYVEYAGKNCIHINSDANTPNIKIPYTVTETSSFTLSYWATITTNYTWQIPLVLNDSKKCISFSSLNTDAVYFGAGNSYASTGSSPDAWNHVVMTYSNGMFKFYINGYIKFKIPYTEAFTSTELSICGNSKYVVSVFGQTVCNAYIRQLCIFDAELNYSQVTDLYAKTQGNLAFSAQANTEVPYFITVRDVEYTSFKASWLGGPADGYTYKLNGVAVTPSTQLSKSVEFTGLSNGTDYSFVITVGEFSSSPVKITTKAPLPAPVNQFIFNNSLEDLGTNPVTATGQGTYTTHSEKVCLDINTNGTTPLLTIPYVITNTSPFTLSFWLHNPYVHGYWSLPIGVDDGSSSILEFALVWDTGFYIIIGNQNGFSTAYPVRTDWTHVAVTYNDGLFEVYCNNAVVFREAHDYTFTSTRINIGGNNNFMLWYFGDQALTSAIAKIRQLCTFDTALTEEQVNDLYIQSQENVTVGVPPNPLKPYNLSLSAITKTSFKVSWQGATGATSYTYTLNGSPATASVEGNSATFSGLIADTTYAIVVTAVNDTETQASRPKSVKTLPEPPVKPVVSVSSQTYNSFTASWTGGTTATSYTYTLNGTAATPSTDNSMTEKTVVFTGLTNSTSYMLVITAINAGGQTMADPVPATTAELPPFPIAIHQLILDNTDSGSQATTITVEDPDNIIQYTTNAEKDCIYINSDGYIPRINIPCVFTQATPFTFSFWVKFNDVDLWNMPVSINGSDISIGVGFGPDGRIYPSISNGVDTNYTQTVTGTYDFYQWNNIVVSYDAGTVKTYVNGSLVTDITLGFPQAFTTSQITIGGNVQYQWLGLGGRAYWVGYVRQICVFDSALTPEDISTLYTFTGGNTVLGVPPNPLKPSSLVISSLTKTSFIVSWSGGIGATSYTYTINGSPVTPSETGNSATFAGLTANTGYTLVITAVNDTESQASAPKSVTTLPNAPVKPVVSVTSQTYNSFTASWTGGAGAASYTYTLDGTAVTPSTDNSLTEKTVVFTGLTNSTAYTLVITAVNAGGQTAADPVTATTAELPPFPVAIHQLILDNTDSGSQATTITVEDPDNNISYTTNDGKDCIYISSDGTNPRINIPCVFTQATPFTIGFWLKFDDVEVWNMPITINGSDVNIGLAFSENYIVSSLGLGEGGYYDQPSASLPQPINEAWTHVVVTYDSGNVKTYVNGNLLIDTTFTPDFTTSQVTIGGNWQYQLQGLGGQVEWAGYVRQICVFDSAMTPEDVSTLYTLTDGNTVLGIPPNPLKPYSLTLSSITTTAFNVSWSGATGATSYTFTLNGSPATPTQVNKTASFTGLTPNTDYTLVITAINDTESQSSAPKNLKTLMLPPTALSLTIGSVTFNSFVATWTGAEGAESYVYTLNQEEITPFTQTANSVTFKSLIPNTAYTLIVTAVNAGGQTASEPSSLTTLFAPPLPYPINQLVLNDSADDVGSEPADVVTAGDIIYTNFGEKDCIVVSVFYETAEVINVPCSLSTQYPFTISFWYFDNTSPWCVPITLNNGTNSRIIFGIGNASFYIVLGDQNINSNSFGAGPSYNSIASNITPNAWNHFTLTVEGNMYKMYVNGIDTASLEYTFAWSTSQMTIGYNINYSNWWTGQVNETMYVRQVCVFDSALIAEQVFTLYTETQDNTVIAPPASPLTPYRVRISSIATTSFNVSWLGGVDALSYSYTLNGTPATPSIDNGMTNKSATFTGLSVGTSYTLVITAIGASESKASNPKNLKTFSMPIRQLILSDSSEDLGTSTLAVESGDIIEYTNYAGRDCVFIVSDGINPTINVPCVFTQTSSFTFCFWINFDNVAGWCVPITMNGTNINITLGFDSSSMHLSLGGGQGNHYTQVHIMHGSDFRTWNHITVTYTNQTVSIYKNGTFAGSQPLTEEFTTSQITIGGNNKYQYALGGQVIWSGYLRQLCVFDSLISQQEISQLYTQTVGNTVIVTIANTLKPYAIDLTNLDFTEFSISWSGAIGATSYTFTLNGAPATPLYEENSVRFTGLIPNTSYTVIVTAISDTDTQSSFSKTVKTRSPLTNPSHQFVFNGSSVDLGTNPSYTIVRDPESIIEYVEYEGKNCVHINSDGEKPNIKIPYVVSNTSPFTLSFWVRMVNNGNWQIPVAIGDGKNCSLFIAILNQELYVGSGLSSTHGAGTNLSSGWNHIVTTYSNKNVRVYANGVIKFTTSFNNSFTSTEINLCGNSIYGTNLFNSTVANAYIRQLCVFDYALNSDHVSQLYVATQGNTSFSQPTAPIYGITLTNVEYTSFDISWLGESATYTLNGAPVTPLTETANSASFTGLSPATTYSLVLISGQYSSTIIISTKKYLSAPVNQFILNNSIQDVGTEPINSSITENGTTYGIIDGKDCVSTSTNGLTPAITIPYVITHTHPFTLSFWINVPYSHHWNVPIGVDDTIRSIIGYVTAYQSKYLSIGSKAHNITTYGGEGSGWIHVVIAYDNGNYTVYMNNKTISNYIFEDNFTSSRINIGGNSLLAAWNLGEVYTVANIRQICTFDYSLNADEVNELYTKTQGIQPLALPPSPLFPYRLTITAVDYTSFTVTWLGGVDAIFYTFTLNGLEAAPSSQTTDSATFTDLVPGTYYTVVVTAVDASTSQASRPKRLLTRNLLPLPINQFIFTDSTDIGIQPVVPTVTDPEAVISYTNYAGKDSVYFITDGILPTMNIPCVFTDSTPFTVGFWINLDTIPSWSIPIAMNGPNIDITCAFTAGEMYVMVGNGQTTSYNSLYATGFNFTTWNHITISYNNGTIRRYINGVFSGSMTFSQIFTTSQITIGGNDKYKYGIGTDSTAWSGYIHQLCVFDYALDFYQANELYTKTADNTVIAIPANLLTPYRLRASELTKTSFTLTWLGGVGATSYIYTVNGAPFTPSSQTGNSAVFTDLTPITQYTIILKAVSETEEIYSAPIVVRTLSEAPTAPSVTTGSLTASSFVASWTGGVGATSYTYTLNGSPATPSSQTPQSATFTELSASTDYTLIVTAVNSSGQTSSTPVTITTLSEGPSAPIVSVSSVTYNSFTVVWTGAEGATSYTYKLNGQPATPVEDGQTATFTDLTPSTNYIIIVTAVNSSGQTASMPISITTVSIPPTTPSLTLTSKTYNSFVISVTGEGATSYTYTLNEAPATPEEVSSTLTFTGLSAATTYTVGVTAINDGGESSASITVTTFSEPPTKPVVSIGSITFNSFVASWTSEGATSYDYTLNGVPVTPEESGNSATFVGLSGATEYTLVVTAVNDGGRTSSVPNYAMTLSNPPAAPSVTVSSLTYNSFVASWTGGDGATSYSYTLNGSAVTPSIDDGVMGETATFTDLTGSTEYTLLITAINEGGQTTSVPLVITTLPNPPTAPSVTVDSITHESAVASWTSEGATSYTLMLNGSPFKSFIDTENSATFIALSGATTYTLIVTAINEGGKNTGTVEFTTLPNPPTAPIVSISDVTYQSFVASWTGGEGADFYTYKLNGSTVTPSVTDKTATFTGLSAATEYTLVVSAINAGGKTVSEPAVITTIVAPPAPLSVTTNTITYQSFAASWTGGEGATSYIYTLNGSPIKPSTDNSLTEKTVIFTELAPATDYTLVVTAVNDGGQISSEPAAARTLSAPPTNITVSINTLTYQSFVATWVGGVGATSYTYKLNDSPVTPSSETANSATFTGLSAETSYTVVVTGVVDGGETSSEPVATTTFSTPPTAPSVSTTSITYSSVEVSWTGGLRATSYSYTLNGSVVTPSSETGSSATFTGLSAATAYTVIVTAVNNGGETASEPLDVTTFRTPPTVLNVSASSITYASFVASWTGGSGATSYTYTLNGTATTPSTDNGVSEKSATFTGLSGSTDYTLVITAVNNGGETASDPLSLKTLDTPAMGLSVSTSAVTYESFVASWTGGDGATSYGYTLNGTPVTPSVDDGLTSKTATFTELSAATSYTLVVTAINNSGSTDAPPVTLTTLRTPPTAISLTSTSITYQSFVASWAGGVGATSYTFTLNGSAATPSSQTASSATFSSLSPVTSYTLVVTAMNNGGEATSEPLEVTTYMTPPTAPSVTADSITYNSFVASWPIGTGAISYTYTLNGSPANPSSQTPISATFTSLTSSTNYTLVVTSVNSGGQASSTPVVVTTYNTPPTIANLSTASITSQSFVASWTAERATSYSYSLNGTSVTPSSQTSSSATFTGLTSATSYTLTVKAINNGGDATSEPSTITTLNQKPTAPIVSTSSVTYQSFVASWTGGSPVSSYVYTLNGVTVTPSTDNGLAGKTATFTSLSSATAYSLIVTAVNNGGETSSAPVIVTTFSTPPTPIAVSTGSVTYSSFVASWTGGVGANSYTFRLNGSIVTPSSQTSNSATFTGLNSATNYTLIITATNNGGEAISPAVMETTIDPPPMAMFLSVNSITYNSFVASWTGGDGASSYGYKLNGSPVTPSVDNGLSNRTATFTGLSGATSYILVVTAMDDGGDTASDPITVTTLPNPPTDIVLTTTSLTHNTLAVSWTGGVGATSYGFRLNGSIVAPSSQTTSSVTFTTLTANTSYSLVVTGVNIGGQTASAPLVVTTLVTPPTALSVAMASITFSSFSASLSGGVGATSYTYTLNGAVVSPSSQSGNTITFASLSAATAYTLVVTAINNGGQVSASPFVVTTLLAPPTTITVSTGSITYNSFVASWAGGSGATSYGFRLNGANVTPSSQTGSSATFTGLSGVTSYTLIVTAINNGGQVSSEPSTITTLLAPPTAIVVSSGSITYNSFVASWTGASGAASYSYTLNGTSVTPSSQTASSATFTDLSGATNYTVVVTAINGGGQVVSAPLVVRTLTKAPTAPSVSSTSITFQSFVATWTGGDGATSYTYTLNGSAATPSSQTTSSATFSPLSPSTNYTVVVTAVNAGGQSSSTPIVVKTLAQQVYPLPIHQLVLSDTFDDSGSAYVNVSKTDPENQISFTNSGGKDCIHIVSDGYIPRINIPRVFTEESSFTLGFWVKFDTIAAWGVPITMNGTNININIGFNASSLYVSAGNGVDVSYAQNNIMAGSDFTQWNHITLTYTNGSIKLYKNGVYSGPLNFTQAFSISKITIGGNYLYQSIGLGGQPTWDGYIRQVCVFDSVINGNDILQLYTKTRDNTVIGPPLPQVSNLKNSFTNTTTVASATEAINAALATNSVVTVVTAALATVLPTVFTALVTNPALVGTTVTIPSSVASTLYAGFEDKSTLNTSLPFNINFPGPDNIVTPPTSTSNSKLAIDLSINTYVAFRGCTGYGIQVLSGDQYFRTPENPLGTLVRVGDVITFVTNAGTTGSFKVADLDIVLIPYTPPTVICFLGSAPVLTPNGYCRIDSLRAGDLVSTREGDTTAVVERVEIKEYMPSVHTNPYIIPAGRFGSNGRILISPRHKVAVNGQMIEARYLGLEQEEQYEKITYYNIQVTDFENIIVAGLEVESLQLLTRINIPMDTFNYIVANKYGGKISREIKENCHLMPDGTMSVPMMV